MSSQKLGIDIAAKDWKEFQEFVNTNYPKDSFTHEQKEFVRKCLLQDNGRCSNSNKLWVSVFAEQLLEFINESWPMDAGSISEQMDIVKTCTAKAIMGFYEQQHLLRQQIAHKNRNAEQNRMLEVHPHIMNFPIDLSIDMGRILNLKSKATSNGTEEQDVHLFRMLYNQIKKLGEEHAGKASGSSAEGADGGQQAPQVVGQAEAGAEWYPHGNDDIFMRLCTYKVWCDKYEREEPWSPNKMCNDWLKEAILLYNNVSYHWTHCKHKYYGMDQFPAIRNTCINNWLPDVHQRAYLSGHKGKKPTTNWITDWCTYPVTEKRHEWESYFCSVISHAKDMAKLMHKPEALHMEIDEGVEEPALKRSRSGDETEQLQPGTAEHKLHEMVKREFAKVERMLHRVETNAQNRHNDSMRELVGHINPLRSQLLQLAQGQGHIYGAIDRVHEETAVHIR